MEKHGLGVYLYPIRGENAVRVGSVTGSHVYSHNTALGKAILSLLSDERVDEIIEHHGLPGTTDEMISTKDELMEKLAIVRGRGVAFDR